jgi:hypothetical protein
MSVPGIETTERYDLSLLPLDPILGRRAVAETQDGPRVGVIERNPHEWLPRVRFADGTWWRAGVVVYLVTEPPEVCAACGAPATDEICDVNGMPPGVTVWVPVCDEHANSWADDDESEGTR